MCYFGHRVYSIIMITHYLNCMCNKLNSTVFLNLEALGKEGKSITIIMNYMTGVIRICVGIKLKSIYQNISTGKTFRITIFVKVYQYKLLIFNQ